MIAKNYYRLRHAIADASHRYGRNLQEIELVAVTKYVGNAEVNVLHALGQRDFGESRVVEGIAKEAGSSADCRWHLIGTLQTNKVRKAVGHFSLIHAVDTLELAQKISQCSQEVGVTSHILLQANTSGEPSKHGQSPEQWKYDFEPLLLLPGLSIDGLMTMAPLTDDEHVVRSCFASLRHLRDELRPMAGGNTPLHHLSMGMSHDFGWAIAEGATLLRIGSALFNGSK